MIILPFFIFSEYSKYFSYLESVLETYFPKIILKCGTNYKMSKSAYLQMYFVSIIGKENFIFLKYLQS